MKKDLDHTKEEVRNEMTPAARYVEQMPKFIGGMDALYEFLGKNLQYPETARVNGIQGTVLVEFIIETDGSVSNVNVLNSISPECDAEAVRVIRKMPKWNPGKQEGTAVRAYYNIPIRFSLN